MSARSQLSILPRLLLVSLATDVGCTWRGGSVGDGDYQQVCKGIGPRTLSSDLDLSYADADDLEALSCVREVEGDVTLFQNTALHSLAGLERLRSVGGTISIVDVPNLTSLGGLAGLKSAGSLYVSACPGLSDLDGLDSLVQADRIGIDGNDALVSLQGLNSELSGLEQEAVQLAISDNSALEDLDALQSFTTVGGLSIWNNTLLETLDGLNNLSSIRGELLLSDSPALRDLTALRGVEEVGGGPYANYVKITANAALQSLEGLENIQTIHGGLVIVNNSVLSSLDGFAGLRAVEGTIEIYENPCLPREDVSDLVAQLDSDEVDITSSWESNGGPCD